MDLPASLTIPRQRGEISCSPESAIRTPRSRRHCFSHALLCAPEPPALPYNGTPLGRWASEVGVGVGSMPALGQDDFHYCLACSRAFALPDSVDGSCPYCGSRENISWIDARQGRSALPPIPTA